LAKEAVKLHPDVIVALNTCVYRKPKRGRSDDEVRRVSRVN
jgi:hypothetical protein